jgi:GntR family transcriptional regulator, transcriptional repressor for pyruvate dehydrogenase complex
MIASPASQAANRIRQYILSHQMKPGDQLPTHDELTQRLNIGQRCLREGLSILRHQGIIETRNKGGTIVRKPTLATLNEPIRWHLDAAGFELEDLVSARAWMECGAAAEAAKRRTARDLLKILDALEKLETLNQGSSSDWQEDAAFHLAIMEATHNSVIVTFGQLVTLNLHCQGTGKPVPRDRRTVFNKEHRNIYEAIERKDVTEARDLMYAHVMDQLGHLDATGKKGRRSQPVG